jgi:hypothetical protein
MPRELIRVLLSGDVDILRRSLVHPRRRHVSPGARRAYTIPAILGIHVRLYDGFVQTTKPVLRLPLAFAVLVDDLDQVAIFKLAKLLKINSPVGDASKVKTLIFGNSPLLGRVRYVGNLLSVVVY